MIFVSNDIILEVIVLVFHKNNIWCWEPRNLFPKYASVVRGLTRAQTESPCNDSGFVRSVSSCKDTLRLSQFRTALQCRAYLLRGLQPPLLSDLSGPQTSPH